MGGGKQGLHSNRTHTESRSSIAASAPPRWLLFLFPSVSDLFFLIVLSSLSTGVLAQKLLGDAGTGWHIRAGEQIVATRSIPRTDSFSISTAHKPWFAWEWLYDASIALVHHIAGLNGVVFITAFVIALTFAISLRLMLRRGATLPVTLALVLLAAGASTIHFLARPHVLSWLLLVIWFELIDVSASRNDIRLMWWLPPMMLFWVNLHGGFLLGFALAVFFLSGKGIDYWRLPEERAPLKAWIRSLGFVTAVSFLITFINPYGYKLHLHIYRYLTDRFLMNHVEEFQSPNFHGLAQQCFALLVLVAIATLSISRRKVQTSHLLILVFAIYSGMYASRNLPGSSILLLFIIAPLLSQRIADTELSTALERPWKRFQSFSARMTAMESRFRGHLWPVIGTAVLFSIALQHGRAGSWQVMDAQFSGKRFPVQAVNYLEQHDRGVPIFAPDYWGGYFIYRLFPHNQVFVDDRHDLYGDAFLKRYLGVIHVLPGWNRVLDDMNANLILSPTDSSLTNVLRETHQWRMEYDDQTAVVFRRDAPQRSSAE